MSAGHHYANLEMLARAGLIAMGRGASVEMAPAWATGDSPMARLINALPKVVFSSSLDPVDWPNASVNAGGDIVVFGGPPFAHSLIRHRSSTSTGSPSIRSHSAAEAR